MIFFSVLGMLYTIPYVKKFHFHVVNTWLTFTYSELGVLIDIFLFGTEIIAEG